MHRQRHCHVSWQDDLVDFLQRIRKAYVEGLCWVLVYYYQAGPTQALTCDCDTVAPFVSFCQGCPSWTWFYPYHYALETRGPMGVAGDHLVCDSLCFTFRDFRPFRSEAICFRLDWLWQPEVRRDQLFPVSWLGICMRGSMVQHHFKLLMRQGLFLHQPPTWSEAWTTVPTFPAADECVASCQCRRSSLAQRSCWHQVTNGWQEWAALSRTFLVQLRPAFQRPCASSWSKAFLRCSFYVLVMPWNSKWNSNRL